MTIRLASLTSMTDTFGDNEPDNDATADDEGHEKKNQTEAGMSFIHRII